MGKWGEPSLLLAKPAKTSLGDVTDVCHDLIHAFRPKGVCPPFPRLFRIQSYTRIA
jgi:hypothetical protein